MYPHDHRDKSLMWYWVYAVSREKEENMQMIVFFLNIPNLGMLQNKQLENEQKSKIFNNFFKSKNSS